MVGLVAFKSSWCAGYISLMTWWKFDEEGCGVTHKVHQNRPKWIQMVTIAWPRIAFLIYPQWQILSISGLNWYLKGDRSQKQSWGGGRVTHEVHRNGPKWTKIGFDGHDSMTKQKCFEFILSDQYDSFLDKMDTWKGKWVRTCHEGVVRSPMRCTKMDQNGPKWTWLVTVAWPRKSFSKFVLSD